jgi:hypothetical protein
VEASGAPAAEPDEPYAARRADALVEIAPAPPLPRGDADAIERENAGLGRPAPREKRDYFRMLSMWSAASAAASSADLPRSRATM